MPRTVSPLLSPPGRLHGRGRGVRRARRRRARPWKEGGGRCRVPASCSSAARPPSASAARARRGARRPASAAACRSSSGSGARSAASSRATRSRSGASHGAVREVRIVFDPAAEDFDIPVVVELDPRPFVGGEPGPDAPARVEAAVADLVRHGLRARVGTRNLRRASGWSGSTRRPGRARPSSAAARARPRSRRSRSRPPRRRRPSTTCWPGCRRPRWTGPWATRRRWSPPPGGSPRTRGCARPGRGSRRWRQRAGAALGETDRLLAAARLLPGQAGELLRQLTETSRSLRSLATTSSASPRRCCAARPGAPERAEARTGRSFIRPGSDTGSTSRFGSLTPRAGHARLRRSGNMPLPSPAARPSVPATPSRPAHAVGNRLNGSSLWLLSGYRLCRSTREGDG